MVRTEWPPRPRLIITVGVVIGLGVPLMFLDSIAMQPGAVGLLIVGNVAAVGLALLLTEGPWRRAAAGFTLTLAFWMALYSTLNFVRWRSTIKTIEWLKVRRIENAKFWEERLDTLPKLESPPYRALARAKLEQRISSGNEFTDGILEERSEQATEWRNGLLLSLTGSVLCAAGATRHLLARRAVCPQAWRVGRNPRLRRLTWRRGRNHPVDNWKIGECDNAKERGRGATCGRYEDGRESTASRLFLVEGLQDVEDSRSQAEVSIGLRLLPSLQNFLNGCNASARGAGLSSCAEPAYDGIRSQNPLNPARLNHRKLRVGVTGHDCHCLE